MPFQCRELRLAYFSSSSTVAGSKWKILRSSSYTRNDTAFTKHTQNSQLLKRHTCTLKNNHAECANPSVLSYRETLNGKEKQQTVTEMTQNIGEEREKNKSG